MEKLKVGEKFLSGTIGGKNGIRIVLFKNKDKKGKAPDFVGNLQIALWVSEKKQGAQELEKVDII